MGNYSIFVFTVLNKQHETTLTNRTGTKKLLFCVYVRPSFTGVNRAEDFLVAYVVVVVADDVIAVVVVVVVGESNVVVLAFVVVVLAIADVSELLDSVRAFSVVRYLFGCCDLSRLCVCVCVCCL